MRKRIKEFAFTDHRQFLRAVPHIGNTRIGDYAVYFAQESDHDRAPGYLMLQPLTEAAAATLPPPPELPTAAPGAGPSSPDREDGSASEEGEPDGDGADAGDIAPAESAAEALAALQQFMLSPSDPLAAPHQAELLRGALTAGRLQRVAPEQLAPLSLDWQVGYFKGHKVHALTRNFLALLKVSLKSSTADLPQHRQHHATCVVLPCKRGS